MLPAKAVKNVLPFFVNKFLKLKVKAVGNKLKVTYKKVKDSNRFQVRYKAKGKWKIKTFKVGNKKKVVKFIKKLKAGKYKVQARAMIKQGKQKAYSASYFRYSRHMGVLYCFCGKL